MIKRVSLSEYNAKAYPRGYGFVSRDIRPGRKRVTLARIPLNLPLKAIWLVYRAFCWIGRKCG